jgi:cobalt-zinc-cadmium efflux system protein
MLVAFALSATFMFAELVGGLLANSLALIADAGHMVSDTAALGLGLFAMWMASHPHTDRRTFGFHRAEILAALANGALLIAIAFAVTWDAVARLRTPEPVQSTLMLVIAVLGLAANLVAMRVLGGHRHESLNVRAAFLHVVSDTLGSLGAIAAGVVIRLTGWTQADSIVSVLIAALILVSGWRLVWETVSVLLESSPAHIDLEALRGDLVAIPGVVDVHDLHVWTVTSGFVSLSSHCRVAPGEGVDEILRCAARLLRERYGIRHVTIQPETYSLHEEPEPCCPDPHDGPPTLRGFLS